MGLFTKKKSPAFTAVDDQELFVKVDYNSVVDWLVGLSDEDYEKVNQVTVIYRAANKETCRVLGVEDKPSTFIIQPEEPATEDDGIEAAFLGDDEPEYIKTPTKKAKTTKAKK